jgi:hypothetical protein
MAYSFTSASSQYLKTSAAPVTSGPFTMACWFRLTSAVSLFQTILSLNNDNGQERFSLILNASSTRFPQLTYNNQSGTINVPFTSFRTGTAIVDTWYHVACTVSGVGAGVTSICYRDGVSGTNGTATNNVNNTIDTLFIGVQHSTLLTNFTDANIAEVGIWNAALNAAEIASLAKGMTCDKVRPQSLVFYAPLVRDLLDQKGGLTITNNNGATVATHPRVYA